jgi:PPIC-type PPIASE domain
VDVADLVQPGGERAVTRHALSLRRRVLRHPVAQFALIGAALLALRGTVRWFGGYAAAATRAPIVISAEHIRAMRAEFEQRWSVPPNPRQLRALIDGAVEDELLYREARVLALGFKDASVRRRLVEKARAVVWRPGASLDELQRRALALGLDDDLVIRRLLEEKMRLYLQRDPGEAPISDAEMMEYMQRHRARFVRPETVTLTHVFFSRYQRGAHLAADAADALSALVGKAPTAAVAELSDPFPLGLSLRAYTPRQLTARFGKPFADRVLAMQPGSWSAPLASPFGLHLVWVHQHEPERLPPLDAVRETVELAVKQERAARNLQTGLARLRALYEVRVEDTR